jgi:hypothetical protein
VYESEIVRQDDVYSNIEGYVQMWKALMKLQRGTIISLTRNVSAT